VIDVRDRTSRVACRLGVARILSAGFRAGTLSFMSCPDSHIILHSPTAKVLRVGWTSIWIALEQIHSAGMQKTWRVIPFEANLMDCHWG